MAEQEVAIEVAVGVGTERIRLLRLPEGATVKRVLIDGQEMPTDLKNAYDRGWIAGWQAHSGGRVPGAVVIGPPGTAPGEANRTALAERLTSECWERLRATWGGPSFDRTWTELNEGTREEIRGFFAPLAEEVSRG